MNQTSAIAVIGGACAGSEFAATLAEAGHLVVVFEQNPLPYGKIEDGLPRWHVKLRQKEMDKIDTRLSHPNVVFVPNTEVGRELSLNDLRQDWGFDLVVLANGAWRDRPLRVKGVDEIEDGSFVYQNPFVHWFNHYTDADYNGPSFTVPEGAVVIGGGLASIDVAKICQFEVVLRKLRQRGISEDIVNFEHYGIEKTLAKHGIELSQLELTPTRIVYRRRIIDMPLVPLADDADESKRERAKKTRQKLVDNGKNRYGFDVMELHTPDALVVENGSVKGVVLRQTEVVDGRVKTTDKTEVLETNFVVSSIGSIPMPLEGVDMDGELYDTEDKLVGRMRSLEGVYCIGNAITGKGNIKESLRSAQNLAGLTLKGLDQPDAIDLSDSNDRVLAYMDYLSGVKRLSAEERARIARRATDLAAEKGMKTDYADWANSIRALRSEA